MSSQNSTANSSTEQSFANNANSIRRIDIQGFGNCLKDDDKRIHPETGEKLSLVETMQIALRRIDAIVNLSTVNMVTSGLDQDISHAIDDALELENHDIEFEVFMMKAKNFLGDNDVDDWNDAWEKMVRRRAQIMCEDRDGTTGTDLMVRITDGGYSGEQYMHEGLSNGVPVINISMSDCIDWEKVDFGDD